MSLLLLLIALAPLVPLLLGKSWPVLPWRRYPAMVARHWLRFGVPAVLLLGVTGQWGAFWALPDAFAPVTRLIGVEGFERADRAYIAASAAIGIAVGIAGGVLLSAWRAWRGRPEGATFGDASAVRPREGELGWAAVLAVSAGVTEEAYFRLLLPLLTAQATGSAVAGFVGATLLFGAAHRYQGWRGVVATTLAGTALTVAYLATATLVAAMAFHAIGDLGHLVLRPAVRGWVKRRRNRG